jgi:predicted metalloprotease with PDZ domain
MSCSNMIERPGARGLAAALLVTAFVTGTTFAQQLPVRYLLRMPAPATHYIEVQATYPAPKQAAVELMMPVWTPGSYLVREFARHVEEIQARDLSGRALTIEKSRKNRWRVLTRGSPGFVLTYRVYAHEQQARTNWVEDSFALINGAPTYITLVGEARRPHEVTLELPKAWSRSLTSLPPAPDGRPHHYRAPDFDTLIDSPILAGNPAVYEFTVDGLRHAVVDVGEAGVWDGARSARDAERIVRAARQLWGNLPYQRYLFFNLLTDRYDGIEHKGSTVLFVNRWSTRTESDYHDWLILATHEFFHAWNVKRLRPVELGPFDYENEVYTRSLWVAEGLSDYYSWVLLSRAGLASREQTLSEVSRAVRSLQTTPGRLVQPLEEASYDAWIKQYRPDENSPNSTVSYYTKGSIVGLLLDARLRRLTNGARNLDDVMQAAYRRFSGERGYTSADFRAIANQVAGTDLADFFHRALDTTEELDYREMLDWYGLRFGPPEVDTLPKAWLGLVTRPEGGRTLVSNVLRDTPAYGSGLTSDDELIAIDDFQLGDGGLDEALARYRPGTTVNVLVSRRGELRRFKLTLGSSPPDRWSVSVRPDATAEQQARLAAWLGRSSP